MGKGEVRRPMAEINALSCGLGDEGEFFRMRDAFQVEIHVEIRPVEMIAVMQFDVE